MVTEGDGSPDKSQETSGSLRDLGAKRRHAPGCAVALKAAGIRNWQGWHPDLSVDGVCDAYKAMADGDMSANVVCASLGVRHTRLVRDVIAGKTVDKWTVDAHLTNVAAGNEDLYQKYLRLAALDITAQIIVNTYRTCRATVNNVSLKVVEHSLPECSTHIYFSSSSLKTPSMIYNSQNLSEKYMTDGSNKTLY